MADSMVVSDMTKAKPRSPELEDDVATSDEMTIVLQADGTIKSVQVANGPVESDPCFSFSDAYLDLQDFGGEKLIHLVDMHSITVLVFKVRDAKTGAESIEKYLWSGDRSWWPR